MAKIKIIDSIMGSGKTTWAIKKMQEDQEHKFIYITPFLDEVTRIKQSVTSKHFYEPMQYGQGKQDSFHQLLMNEKNIASTHALFRMSNNTTKELIKSGEYVLILDEVMDVLEPIPLGKDDIPDMLALELITIGENGVIIWREDKEDYDGKYNDIRTMSKNHSLVFVNNVVLMWNFPASVFEAFEEIYLLTYMFDAQIQRYYYDLFGVEYEYNATNGKELLPYNGIAGTKKDVPIKILDYPKMNSIGSVPFSLSYSWYRDKDNSVLIDKIKKNYVNFFQNIMKGRTKTEENMWTGFLDTKAQLAGKGYTKGFVPINSRATNIYRGKKTLAYGVNRFLSPLVEQYFNTYKVRVEEDGYALSEMLQWIWRSAIRENQEITIYIPSKRMRNLLINWIEEVSGEPVKYLEDV